MKILRIFAFAVVLSLGLAGTSSQASEEEKKDSEKKDGATEETAKDEAADVDDDVFIKSVTLARDTGKKFEETKNFTIFDTYCALVKLSEPKVGTRVKCIWKAIEAGELKGQRILETEVVLTPETLKAVKEPDRIDFTLPHLDPAPAGEYKAEIYLNGKLAQVAIFQVQ